MLREDSSAPLEISFASDLKENAFVPSWRITSTHIHATTGFPVSFRTLCLRLGTSESSNFYPCLLQSSASFSYCKAEVSDKPAAYNIVWTCQSSDRRIAEYSRRRYFLVLPVNSFPVQHHLLWRFCDTKRNTSCRSVVCCNSNQIFPPNRICFVRSKPNGANSQ